MDPFDDLQVEEFYPNFDFVEEMNEDLFDEEDDQKCFDTYFNSNTDY